MPYNTKQKKISQLTKGSSLTDDTYYSSVQGGVNKTFTQAQIIADMADVYGASLRTYATESALIADDIALGEYAIVEENNYSFYKITNDAATAPNIGLTSGLTATFVKVIADRASVEYDSVASFILASPQTESVEIKSYYGGWAATIAGPKGAFTAHKTGATNAAPTAGTAVSVSSIGGGDGTGSTTGQSAQAGYFFTADGAEWKFSDAGLITPECLGAYGDGSADDTTAMSDFFRLPSLSLYFSDRAEYVISSTISNAVSDRILFAQGATIKPTADIGGTDYCIENTASRFNVRDLKISGVASTTLCGGLGFTTGDGCEVDSCYFYDLDNGGAIVSSAAAVGHAFTNNYIYNCAPVALGGLQYGAINCNATKSTISNNRIIFCGQTGISSANPISLVINSNYIDGQNTSNSGGIIFDGAGNGCAITGNVIKDVRVEGVQVANSVTGQASEDHAITGNTIISTRAANDGPVSGITLVSSGTGTVERVVVSGNTIRADDRGVTSSIKLIDIDGAIDSTITGNTLEGGYVGIGFTSDSPGTVISGNTLRNQDAVGISTTAGGNEILITGNRIKGDGSGGSTTGITFNSGVGGGYQKITGNLISDCLVGINSTFSGSERSFIDNNHFIRNGTDISATSSTINSISNNTYNSVRSGTATLVAGTIAVSATALQARDRIRLSVSTIGGAPGSLYVSTRSNGTSFTIASTSGSDTSAVDWELIG